MKQYYFKKLIITPGLFHSHYFGCLTIRQVTLHDNYTSLKKLSVTVYFVHVFCTGRTRTSFLVFGKSSPNVSSLRRHLNNLNFVGCQCSNCL